jgi:hypothetical protein
MSTRITTILAVVIMAVTVSATASAACPPRALSRCIDRDASVDLNSVPDIANRIVRNEPAAERQEQPAVGSNAPTAYTGPTVGAIQTGKRIPTIGYSWSLE